MKKINRGIILLTGFGESGPGRGRDVEGAAGTVSGAAGFTEQSKAGGRG